MSKNYFDDIEAIITKCIKNLEDLKARPNSSEWLKKHDPFAGHTPSTAKKGKSRFYTDLDMVSLLKILREHSIGLTLEERNEPRPVRLIMVKTSMFIGEKVTLDSKGGKVYIFREHGNQKGFLLGGEFFENKQPTQWVTIALTPEKTGLCLASVYPGTPNLNQASDFTGIEYGDIISSEEAMKRGIRVLPFPNDFINVDGWEYSPSTDIIRAGCLKDNHMVWNFFTQPDLISVKKAEEVDLNSKTRAVYKDGYLVFPEYKIVVKNKVRYKNGKIYSIETLNSDPPN